MQSVNVTMLQRLSKRLIPDYYAQLYEAINFRNIFYSFLTFETPRRLYS